jgi:hypothetical protein
MTEQTSVTETFRIPHLLWPDGRYFLRQLNLWSVETAAQRHWSDTLFHESGGSLFATVMRHCSLDGVPRASVPAIGSWSAETRVLIFVVPRSSLGTTILMTGNMLGEKGWSGLRLRTGVCGRCFVPVTVLRKRGSRPLPSGVR